ncbi:MAG: 5-(carboxyamino)imidazole ribonucleotide synthase [Hyphomicrobiales bacterium]|nr:5-(carboxyamino)imidazole ribonucleotide synthase [Hyphomicrobiales bacterium]
MAETPRLTPAATIGILGGGQLGRMLALAAADLGLKTHVLCPEPDSPAFEVTRRRTVADYGDEAALDLFARDADVITYEFENVPSATVAFLRARRPVLPDEQALDIAQDRRKEKSFLEGLGIAVAPYRRIGQLADIEPAAAEIGLPAVLKTCRLGYDGKGQYVLREAGDARAAWAGVGEAASILEAFVPFAREISIIAARSADGRFTAYDPPENVHKEQILRRSQVPARISVALAEEAEAIARKVADALDYVGVLAIELFVVEEEGRARLIATEIAPRVHNSGHWTMDACRVSQFEQHIRAVAGWPLGPAARDRDAVMDNLIGEEVEGWPQLLREPDACLHLYGKARVRAGRKMGHVTRLSPLGSLAQANR